MKKKSDLNKSELKDWNDYIKNPQDIFDKDENKNIKIKNYRYRFDLHGFSLDEANTKVEEIITYCSSKNYNEILFITGKGLHSSNDDVFKSSSLNKLKYSVPDYIKNNSEISNLIVSITSPQKSEGGEGALLVKLKTIR